MKRIRFVLLSIFMFLMLFVWYSTDPKAHTRTMNGPYRGSARQTFSDLAFDQSVCPIFTVIASSPIADGAAIKKQSGSNTRKKQMPESPERNQPREVYYTDGSRYSGDIINGKRHGQGVYIWPKGHKYMGEWKYNKMHGQGIFVWPNGDKYVGEFRDNRASGGWLYKAHGRKIWGYQNPKGEWIFKEQ
jgi:hypothetical protein